MMNQSDLILFDAGLFIGALLSGDTRHTEARPLVESARRGDLAVCTTTGILSEVYAALTWIHAQPCHRPETAANAVRLLVEPPSAIQILSGGVEASQKMLELAEKHGLTARRIHDARHAALALSAGVTKIYTYDVEDWRHFQSDGLVIVGPSSSLSLLRG
ncbi:MAG: type II toxin-antitoxin system VapC family toxin [Pseudomonadota bacterium]